MPDTSFSDYEFSELIPIGGIGAALPPPPNGEKYAISSIYHWLNLSAQNRRTLRSVQIGKHRYVTAKWLREFFEGTSPAMGQPRTPGQRERSREAAKRSLEKAGI